MVLAALLLLIGYIIYLRATLCSSDGFGILLVLALVGALLWVLYYFGVLSLDNTGLDLLVLSLVRKGGLSSSHVRRALSAQANIDDVES